MHCTVPLGDLLLKEIGRVITENTRSIDTSARLGGDEFAVLLSGCSVTEATHVAEKLSRAVSKIKISTSHYAVANPKVSIGIANVDGDHQHTTPVDLHHRADMALYSAKHLGKNQVYVHHPRCFSSIIKPL